MVYFLSKILCNILWLYEYLSVITGSNLDIVDGGYALYEVKSTF